MICEVCAALREREENPDDASPCMRCLARQNGWKCQSCGSPWVYLRADGSHYDDGNERLLCKPCTYTLIHVKGLSGDVGE